ncbi:hypothetical protein GQX74_003537 [Glossina fuscipes]|nr:hypothetical protein GQX74_003537 [Glossina fuscipes]
MATTLETITGLCSIELEEGDDLHLDYALAHYFDWPSIVRDCLVFSQFPDGCWPLCDVLWVRRVFSEFVKSDFKPPNTVAVHELSEHIVSDGIGNANNNDDNDDNDNNNDDDDDDDDDVT